MSNHVKVFTSYEDFRNAYHNLEIPFVAYVYSYGFYYNSDVPSNYNVSGATINNYSYVTTYNTADESSDINISSVNFNNNIIGDTNNDGRVDGDDLNYLADVINEHGNINYRDNRELYLQFRYCDITRNGYISHIDYMKLATMLLYPNVPATFDDLKWTFKQGDTNCDNAINVCDITYLQNVISNYSTISYDTNTSLYMTYQYCDVNRDSTIDVSDITYLIRIILDNEVKPATWDDIDWKGNKQGDVNNDGRVNVSDITYFNTYMFDAFCTYQNEPEKYMSYKYFDVNRDGEINVTDLVVLQDMVLYPAKPHEFDDLQWGDNKPGDTNNDGRINVSDITYLREVLFNNMNGELSYMNEEGLYMTYQFCDVNRDGRINVTDLTYLNEIVLYPAKPHEFDDLQWGDNKPGDTNNDGRINVSDITYLREVLFNNMNGELSYMNEEGLYMTYQFCDVNRDGRINVTDLTYLNEIVLYPASPHEFSYLKWGNNKPGDTNNDGRINVSDITYLRNVLLNNMNTELSYMNEESLYMTYQFCDVNRDGRINVTDLTYLNEIVLYPSAARDFSALSWGKNYPGDTNNDTYINVSDYTYLKNVIVKYGDNLSYANEESLYMTYQYCDVNRDGKIDVSDLTYLNNIILNQNYVSTFANANHTDAIKSELLKMNEKFQRLGYLIDKTGLNDNGYVNLSSLGMLTDNAALQLEYSDDLTDKFSGEDYEYNIFNAASINTTKLDFKQQQTMSSGGSSFTNSLTQTELITQLQNKNVAKQLYNLTNITAENIENIANINVDEISIDINQETIN